MSLGIKEKTFNGLYWNGIDTMASYGIQFILHIVLARLLLPSEYGLVGMVSIFIALASSFVDCGFGQAIIYKKNATDTDYSTVFYFSLGISICLYALLFFTAHFIAHFFKEPILVPLLRVIALQLIISPFVEIQRTRLICKIDFKTQAIITFISNFFAGIVSLFFAYKGFGVWSLVIWKLTEQCVFCVLIWFKSKWRPLFVFSYPSFKELFGFGSKLLIGSLVETIYRELNKFVIAKFYSPAQLGYFTRAEQFGNLPAMTLSGIVSKVSYPTLVCLREDPESLKLAFSRILRSTMFISFLGMFTIAAIANSLVITLIGHNWSTSILYLQIICLYGVLYPLHALNLNLLKVYGRSDIVLKLELIKRSLAVPIVIVGIYYGIVWLLIGTVIHSVVCYSLNAYWSGKMLHYGMKQQIIDLTPSFVLAIGISVSVYFIGQLVNHLCPPIVLIIQLFSWILLVISISEIFKQKDYLFIKGLIMDRIKKVF